MTDREHTWGTDTTEPGDVTRHNAISTKVYHEGFVTIGVETTHDGRDHEHCCALDEVRVHLRPKHARELAADLMLQAQEAEPRRESSVPRFPAGIDAAGRPVYFESEGSGKPIEDDAIDQFEERLEQHLYIGKSRWWMLGWITGLRGSSHPRDFGPEGEDDTPDNLRAFEEGLLVGNMARQLVRADKAKV